MKILIAAQVSSPDQPNAEALVAELSQSLAALGHETDVFGLPAIQAPRLALQYSLAASLLDVGSSADQLVTLGWHCHLLVHPSKIAVVHHSDPLLALGSGSADSPALTHNRTAAANAFRRCRRVVASDESTRSALSRIVDPQLVTVASPLFSPESVEKWLQ